MLRLFDLSFGYNAKPLVEHLSLAFADGARQALLGASGCGKSTLLRLLLVAATSEGPQLQGLPWQTGRISVEPQNSIVGYVPQEASLAPWLNVKSNITHGLRLAARPESAMTYSDLIHLLKLREFEDLFPHQISTGTTKRVALARALILSPTMLLLDEPFAGFDFDLREHAISLIKGMTESRKTTILLVTHEPYEVARLCESAHILSGSPAEIAITIQRNAATEEIFRATLLKELQEYLTSDQTLS